MEKTEKRTLRRTECVRISLVWGKDDLPEGDIVVEAFADDEGWLYSAMITKAELEAMGGVGKIRKDEYADAARRKLEAKGHVIADGIWSVSQNRES